ncbi:MAG: response regulator [Leptospirales bacterium]|nr:response regulator [Leptospirales bacterium]MCL2155979.1 response regulator [Leptospirales bacterium]
MDISNELTGMNILVAEDQQMARDVLCHHLQKWGHNVTEAPDGKEALAKILESPDSIDVLITDWNMPIMDGIELSQRVREITSTSHYIYIILLTSKGDFSDIVQGFTQGKVDDYIPKPFEDTELQLRLQVGYRLISSERKLRMYNENLEMLVREQTKAIRETQEEIISRLFSALESRDQETAEHVQRIGLMSANICSILGWDHNKIDTIQAAAPLHDIGKIGISDNILLKPGPLTKEEMLIIQQHAAIGAKILSGSNNPVIQMAEMIAHYHHENWDGTGYPAGLKEDEIPIEAQIVSITDFYDALLSDRVYRKGLPEDEIIDMIKSLRGKKFSATLTDIFLEHLHKIK